MVFNIVTSLQLLSLLSDLCRAEEAGGRTRLHRCVADSGGARAGAWEDGMHRGDQRGHRTEALLPFWSGDGTHGGGLPGGGEPGERLRPLHQVHHVRNFFHCCFDMLTGCDIVI